MVWLGVCWLDSLVTLQRGAAIRAPLFRSDFSFFRCGSAQMPFLSFASLCCVKAVVCFFRSFSDVSASWSSSSAQEMDRLFCQMEAFSRPQFFDAFFQNALLLLLRRGNPHNYDGQRVPADTSPSTHRDNQARSARKQLILRLLRERVCIWIIRILNTSVFVFPWLFSTLSCKSADLVSAKSGISSRRKKNCLPETPLRQGSLKR